MNRKLFSLSRWMLPLCAVFMMGASALHSSESGDYVAKTSVATQPVEARLISEQEAIQPGKAFWVGVELTMEKGWDTYWINPGDAGFPTQVNWELPDGFTAGPLQWPYPEKFTTDALVGYGYTNKVVLLSEITPPAKLSLDEPVTLMADVSWLACKDQCQPGEAHIELNVPVSKTASLNPAMAAEFSQARAKLPTALEGEIAFTSVENEAVLKFHPKSKAFGEIERVEFIPEQGQVIDDLAPQRLQVDQSGFTLNMKLLDPTSSLDDLKGVLLISEKGNQTLTAVQIGVPQITAAVASVTDGVSSFWVALGFAFVGGIILNVMPCVLPVIALKIFSFIKMADQKRSEIMKHGVMFTLGVLISFWVLSGALLVLRAYGESLGWGFQLQEPVFVVILTVILFLLGLSLFGVFEMGTSLISLGQKTTNSGSPLRSSFLSGILATLVATPCTGPLLGPALGFAMTLPTVMALSIFTAMGLGMASPYLFFSAFPKLVKFMPKPGNWMIIFKQLMGFLMMGTVVWLIWVFGAQTDNMAIFVLLAGLLLMSIGAWIYGRWATPLKKRATRRFATLIAAALVAIGGWSAIKMAREARDTPLVAQQEGDWVAFSPEKVASLQAAGTPVFVDFTAKWCLICQANKVTLHSSDVMRMFKEKGVVVMSADWTKKDSIITEELAKLGRSGVPVYALYPGETGARPSILPQTLTQSIVIDYLSKLPTSKLVEND